MLDFLFYKEVIGWLGPLQRGKKNFWVFLGVFENHPKNIENTMFLKISIAIKFFHGEFLKREFTILIKRSFGI